MKISLAVLVLFATEVPLIASPDVAVGGTMVVAVRFDNGLVICADKRSHLDSPGAIYRDDDVKMTIVNQNGGFATAGVPIFEREDGVRTFDADRLIRDYFGEQGFNELNELAKRVDEGFRAYLLSKHPDARPPTHWDEGRPVLFRAMIFFRNGRAVDLYELELEYINDVTPAVHVVVQNRSNNRLRAYGTLVLNEIMRGTDQRFADLRTDPVFASVLKATWASQVREEEALGFAKRSIAVTSERISLLDRSLQSSYGPTSDCAVVRGGSGVQWLPNGK